MLPTALLPVDSVLPDQRAIDLTRTPMPPLPTGTVRSDVNIFRAEEAVESALDPFPKPGDEFYGFELAEELGRGAFGRVFLGRERGLANRPVVLKVALKANDEKLRLARLQHTNIVPIQNAFRRGPYHVVQMPYFGRQTLADVIDHVRTETCFPNVGGEVFTTVAKATTQRISKAHSSKSDSGIVVHESGPAPDAIPGGESECFTEAHPLRDLLTGLPYPDAVLAIVRRLADGLAHAHNRGILHLDLKPQNVLFSNDGQPMLLDFNLAADRSVKDRKRVGGTWPYMAPEVIREFAKLSDEAPDERTDLYALGVIYFELLTCRLPFSPIRKVPEDLPGALAERERGLPSIREINPDVPAAVEAIIRKLAAPNPADRYANVDELREDLQRQQENRPLRHAADRNPVERFRKWRRRNPNAVSKCIGSAAILSLTVAGFLLWNSIRQQAAARVDREVVAMLADHELARSNLGVPTDVAARGRGIESATKWLDHFGAGRPNWIHGDAIRALAPDRRRELLDALGESALLVAHAETLQARGVKGDDKALRLDAARKWNRIAEECYGDTPIASVFEQRAILDRLEGADATDPPVPTADETDADRFYRAVRSIGDGKMGDAIESLKQLTEIRPNHYAGQLMLGMSLQVTGQPHRALERLLVARPLAPNDPRPGYHLGVLYLHMGKLAEAEKELTAVLAKNPDHAQSLQQRGLVHRNKRDYAAAIADFTAAIERGGPAIPLHYYRAEVHALAGHVDDAKTDRATAASLPPKTADDYSVQAGQVRHKDPAKALELYNRAIELNPFFLAAWHNKAYVLSEKLDEWDLAREAMAKATEIAPSYSPSRACLAVLLARTGKRDEAHKEIQKALVASGDAEIAYLASCVFALTSETHPEDRATALNHFRQCFRDGYRNFQLVKGDRDMKKLLEQDDFKAVFEAAQQLVK